ncbi:MAG: hypothetical protein KJ043_09545 [Anaerolineae bacterium]|nr:hypothetical protein [Anaerolineae bacterium]
MKPVIVVISEFAWTVKAMHLACALARNTQAPLMLLDFRMTKNVGLLGMGISYNAPTIQEYAERKDYLMIAEDYGVLTTLQPVEYESFSDALVQMVELFEPQTIFAALPKSVIPFFSPMQLRAVRRQLGYLNCKLYTLNETNNQEVLLPQMGVLMPK